MSLHAISCQYPCELIYQHFGLINCLPFQSEEFLLYSILIANWHKPSTSTLGMLQLQYLKFLKKNNFYFLHTSYTSVNSPFILIKALYTSRSSYYFKKALGKLLESLIPTIFCQLSSPGQHTAFTFLVISVFNIPRERYTVTFSTTDAY